MEGQEDIRVSVGKKPVSMSGREMREVNGGGCNHSAMYIGMMSIS